MFLRRLNERKGVARAMQLLHSTPPYTVDLREGFYAYNTVRITRQCPYSETDGAP